MKETIIRIFLGAGIVGVIGSIIFGIYYLFDKVIPDPFGGILAAILLGLLLLWLVGSMFRS